jgi:hypothetical protein
MWASFCTKWILSRYEYDFLLETFLRDAGTVNVNHPAIKEKVGAVLGAFIFT